MCCPERCTERRGREPIARRNARRTRALRRSTWLRSLFIVRSPSLLLAFLAEDVFARVFDALALVGLGRPEIADLGRHLAHLLLVDAGDHDLGRARRGDLDAVRDRVADVV